MTPALHTLYPTAPGIHGWQWIKDNMPKEADMTNLSMTTDQFEAAIRREG